MLLKIVGSIVDTSKSKKTNKTRVDMGSEKKQSCDPIPDQLGGWI